MIATEKRKFPAAEALAVAREICAVLKPATEALIVAGSLRRRRPLIGDVEILFIPKHGIQSDTSELFERKLSVDEAEMAIWRLLAAGTLAKRLNVKGSTVWGQLNKLAVHVATGIPVDFFVADSGNWWNLVVCRTGNAQHNIRICEAARARSWTWNPYGEGYYDRHGELKRKTTSERDVFDAVGLKYAEPWERSIVR